MSTSINPYSNAASATSTRNGIGGLVSGMDTDSLVESMTGNITDKINSLKQQQQVLTWQQEAYQGIIDSLINFNTKYLSSTSNTSLGNPNFFQNATITSLGSNSGAVSATGTVSSIKDLVIRSVNQLAKTASITTGGNHSVSSQSIDTGTIDLGPDGRPVSALEGEGLNFTYGNKKYTVQMEDVQISSNADPAEAAKENAQFAVEAMNKALKKAGLGESVSAKLEDSRLTLTNTGTGGNTLTLTGASKKIAEITGFEMGKAVSEGSKLSSGKFIDTVDSGLTEKITFKDAIAKGDGTMTFDLDGRKAVVDIKKIMKKAEDDGVTFDMDYLAAGINDQLKDKLGANKVTVTATGGGGSTGGLSFTTASPTSILSVADGDSGVLGKTGGMNLNFGAANRMLMYEPLSSSSNNLNTNLDFGTAANPKTYGFRINDVEFEIGAGFIKVNGTETKYERDVTLNDIMTSVNDSDAGVTMKYLSTVDQFTVTAKDTGAAGKIDIKASSIAGVQDMSKILFGEEADFSGAKKGEDSSMTVSFDGGRSFVDVERSSNNFSMDGVTFTLNSTFASSSAPPPTDPVAVDKRSGDDITFSAKTNTEDITKVVKGMVDDYNKMIEVINKAVNTKKDRNYEPLTDAQKKAMSEDEIKAWNEKAQEGMLFGDSMLRSLANELRFAFSMPISGSGFPNIGITTSSDYADNGKLKLNEADFKAALEGNSDMVAKLFTSTSKTYKGEETSLGAMVAMTDTVQKFASTSGATKGALVEKAGAKGSALSISNSTIYKQMKTLQGQIDVWGDRLDSAKDRYYRQFTQMEVYMSKWNSQSSMFQSQG